MHFYFRNLFLFLALLSFFVSCGNIPTNKELLNNGENLTASREELEARLTKISYEKGGDFEFKAYPISESMIKRNNYTNGVDKYPNHFLWDARENYKAPKQLNDIFRINETELKIGKYKANWKNLFETISKLVKDGTKNVFICAHQHLLLEKFFHFIVWFITKISNAF